MLDKRLVLAVVLALGCCRHALAVPYVDDVQPRLGSTEGGTRITLTGSDFSATADNQVFIGDFECAVEPFYCTSTQIVCLSPAIAEDNTLPVTVVSDGVTAECRGSRCYFTTRSWRTPTITQLWPTSGPVGGAVQIRGSFGHSSTDATRFEDITVGDVRCNKNDAIEDGLVEPNNDYYLDRNITCYALNDSPGYYNASVTLGGDRGKAVVQDGNRLIEVQPYQFSPFGGSYMYQVFPTITSVSHAAGSVAGGLEVTITGTALSDGTMAHTAVDVDGTECTVTSATNTQITCTTAMAPNYPTPSASNQCNLHRDCFPRVCGADGACASCATATDCPSGTTCNTTLGECVDGDKAWSFLGGRGATRQVFDMQGLGGSVPVSAGQDRLVLLETVDALVSDYMIGEYYAQVFDAVFVPWTDGNFTFYVTADDDMAVFLSELNSAEEPQLVIERHQWMPLGRYFEDDNQHSNPIPMTAGSSYLITAHMREWAGGDHFGLGVRVSADEGAENSVREIQEVVVDIGAGYNEDIQLVRINATAGTFRLGIRSQQCSLDGSCNSNCAGACGTYCACPYACPEYWACRDTCTDTCTDCSSTFEYSRELSVTASANTVLSALRSMEAFAYWDPYVERSDLSTHGGYQWEIRLPPGHTALGELFTLSTTTMTCAPGAYCVKEVVQLQSASDAYEGSFTLSFAGATTRPLELDIVPDCLAAALGELETIGKATAIQHWNYGEYPRIRRFNVYLDGVMGPADLLTAQVVSHESVVGTPTVEVSEKLKGSTDRFYAPIAGDVLRVVESLPQLHVTVGNAPARCDTDCAFEYDDASTPVVQTVTHTAPTATTRTITISGELLQQDGAATSVMVGDAACDVQTLTATSVECLLDLTACTAGTQDVRVTVSGVGDALVVAANPTIAVPLAVSSISPESASVGGGSTVTIAGAGFGSSAAGVGVAFGAIEGTVVAVSPTSLQVQLPAAPAGATTCTVTVGQESATIDFAFTEVASVTSVSPSVTTVHSLTLLTIAGSGLGATDGITVTVGGQPCHVVASDATSIECNVGGGPVGTHDIVVHDATTGFVPGSLTLERQLAVSSVSPASGGELGGTEVVVSGVGFSPTPSNNQVRFGDRPCDVVSATATGIVCRTRALLNADPAVAVSVQVGQFASECSGACVFTYDADLTPLVSGVAQSGDAQTSLVISGSGFEPGATRVFVTPTAFNPLASGASVLDAFLANDDASVAECSATAPATASEIQCEVAPAPAVSTQWVWVLTDAAGVAASDQQVSFPLGIASVSPATVVSAGAMLTLSGHGFGADPSAVSVTAAGRECVLYSVARDTLVCEAGWGGVVEQRLVVTVNGVVAETVLPYTAGHLRMTALTTEPHDPLNITATLATLLNGRDDLGFWLELVADDGREVARTPAVPLVNFTTVDHGPIQGAFLPEQVPAGTFRVRAEVSDRGYSRVPGYIGEEWYVSGNLSVTGAAPATSSFEGGQEIVVSGSGFDAAATTASLCNTECAIKEGTVTHSGFTCVTAPLVTTHSRTTLGVGGTGPVLLNGTQYVSSSHHSNEGPEAAFDDDTTTFFDSSDANCFFGHDFGDKSAASLSHVRMFPRNANEWKLVGGLVEGSNDLENGPWDVLVRVAAQPDPGWTEFASTSTDGDRYRFLRYRNPTAGAECEVAGLQMFGTVYYADDSSDCALEVSVNGVVDASLSVAYADASTPVLTAVSPAMGTTAGGVEVVLSGSGFGTVVADVAVEIDGVMCAVASVQDDAVTCVTGARPEFVPSSIEITVAGKGRAANPSQVGFLYTDRWSEASTWGGNSPPVEGDSVFIPSGQHILLDESTPKLELVLIEGTLQFEDARDLTMDCSYIFVRHGHLIVGTEDEPFQHKAVITLHGEPNMPRLPMYGAKHIAVRYGTLDLHGKEFLPSWTRLAQTAAAGSTSLTLAQTVQWEVGQQIVLASSSFDMHEAEELTITSVSGNVVGVDPPLQFAHFGEIETHGGKAFDMRAEVGLLSRNVKVQGDPTSPDNLFGAHIMLASPGNDSTIGRISNVECFQCGQASQLGRYPVHFHMIGAVTKSYIRNCAIHHTYNRAVTVHGVYFLRVLDNVGYNTMGHTFFVEDGVEMYNIVDGNLGLVTRASGSLLDTDTTPATFWITNPTNVIRNNAAAGSERYGFWYDLPLRPTGVSLGVDDMCPRGLPLLEFSNNSAHSNGRYGLRIFDVFVPRQNPCSPDEGLRDAAGKNFIDYSWDHTLNPPITANFYGLTSYKNGRVGAIGTLLGDVRFHDFRLADNMRAGVETQMIIAPANTAGTYDSVVVAHTGNQEGPLAAANVVGEVGTFGFVAPRKDNYTVQHTSFHRFDRAVSDLGMGQVESMAVFGSCSHCNHHNVRDNGARTTTFRNITLVDSPNGFHWGYPYKAIFRDMDGSMVGNGNSAGYLTPGLAHLRVDGQCDDSDTWTDGAFGRGVLACGASVQLRRLAIWGAAPSLSFSFKDLAINDTRTYAQQAERTSFTPMLDVSDPSNGWAVPVAMGTTYDLWWRSYADFDSLTLYFHDMEDGDFVYLRFNYTEFRHHFEMRSRGQAAEIGGEFGTVPPPTSTSGSFFHNTTDHTVTVLFSSHGSQGPFVFTAHTCPREEDGGCPIVLPEDVQRESFIRHWSNATQWIAEGHAGVPAAGEDVVVRAEWQLVIDMQPADIGTLTVLGVLRFSHSLMPGTTELRASSIFVRGGHIEAGTTLYPYAAVARIVLTGTRQSDALVVDDAIDTGNMVLAVFGSMSLVGKERQVTWTRLAAPAAAGTTTITLARATSWGVGEQITIASTDFEYSHHETRTIAAVDGSTLTLDAALSYNHHGAAAPEVHGGMEVETRAEVALVSHNVQIVGENPNANEEWGGRVLVSTFQDGDVTRTGVVTLSNVEIRNCGQVDTQRAALTFEDMDASSSIVRGLAIRQSFNRGIRATRVTNLSVRNCVVDSSLGSSFVLESVSGSTLQSNLAIGTYKLPNDNPDVSEPETLQVLAGFELCATTTCSDTLVTGNVAAGSANYGFIVFGQECGDSDWAVNNLAHSARTGAWLQTDRRIVCTTFGDFTAHKCTEFGVVLIRNSGTTNVRRVAVADSVVGLSLNPGQPRDDADMRLTVEDSVVVGRTVGNPGCGYDGEVAQCGVGQSVGCSSRWGMHTVTFRDTPGVLNKGMPPSRSALPWNNIHSDAQFGGAAVVQRVAFANFEAEDECGNPNAVLKSNPDSADLQAVMAFSDISLDGVDDSALMHFEPPNDRWLSKDDCDGFHCSGPYNIVVRNDDGSFLGTPGHAVSFSPISAVANPTHCTHRSAWNGFLCSQAAEYGLLVFESLDPDTLTRNVGPAYVNSTDGYVSHNMMTSFMDHGWDTSYSSLLRLSRFPSTVETGRHYNLSFTGTNPRDMRFGLFRSLPAGDSAVVVSLWYGSPELLEVAVDGEVVASRTAAVTVLDAAGENNYVRRERKLTFVVREGVEVKLRTVDAVQVSLTLATSVSSFYDDDGESRFVDRIAFVLNISPQRIRVVEVVDLGQSRKQAGSQIEVNFAVLDEREIVTPSPSPTPSMAPFSSPSSTPSFSLSPAATPSRSSSPLPDASRTPSPTSSPVPLSTLSLDQVFEQLTTILQDEGASAALGLNASVVTFHVDLSVDAEVPCLPECVGPNGTTPAQCVEGVCQCNEGFFEVLGSTAEPIECAPVDECATNNGGCDANADCEDLGSVQCTCRSGFSGDGQTCQPSDADDDTGAIVAGVLVPLVVIGAGAAAFVCWRRRRQMNGSVEKVEAIQMEGVGGPNDKRRKSQPQVILVSNSPQLSLHHAPTQPDI